MHDRAAFAAAHAWGNPVGQARPVRAGRHPLFDITFADGRRVALRLYDPATDRRAIADGLRLAEALADAGLATPWPQRTRDGALIRDVAGMAASALQWSPACPRPSGLADPARLHAVGALLADLHLTADTVAPADLRLPDRRPPAPAAIATDDPALARATDIARAAWAARADAPTAVILDDPGAVLSGPDGLWLIGCDRAGTGWRAQDLAAALWPVADAPDLPALRAALVAGYIAGGGDRADADPGRIALCLLHRALQAAAQTPRDPATSARIVVLARGLPG